MSFTSCFENINTINSLLPRVAPLARLALTSNIKEAREMGRAVSDAPTDLASPARLGRFFITQRREA